MFSDLYPTEEHQIMADSVLDTSNPLIASNNYTEHKLCNCHSIGIHHHGIAIVLALLS